MSSLERIEGADVALTERERQVLEAVVRTYVATAEPAGSRTVSKGFDLGVSAATIRNVMSDLEELGLLRAPHTSAGRVPTVQGYRLFVDNLLTVSPLESAQIELLQAQFDANAEREALVGTASNLLSEVTRLAGIVTLPRQEGIKLRQVEFLPLSERQVLAIVVVNDREDFFGALHQTLGLPHVALGHRARRDEPHCQGRHGAERHHLRQSDQAMLGGHIGGFER